MRKLFTFISAISFTFVISCSPTKNVQTDSNTQTAEVQIDSTLTVSVTSVKTLKPDTLTTTQMDSVINVDKLPVLSKWTQSTYKDDETRQLVTYKTLFDSTSNTVYTVKVLGSSVYVLSKRTVKTK